MKLSGELADWEVPFLHDTLFSIMAYCLVSIPASRFVARSALPFLAVFLLGTAWISPGFAGVAMCKRALSGGQFVHEFRNDPLRSSHHLRSLLYRELKETYGSNIRLNCYNPWVDPGEYHFAIGITDRINYEGERRVRIGFGLGGTKEEAEKDLIGVMMGEDWGWSLKRDGLQVLESSPFVEPDPSTVCFALVRYRDGELVNDFDDQIKALRKAEEALEFYERIRSEVSADQESANVIRKVEQSTRILNALAAFLSSYTPASSAVYQGGTLGSKILVSIKIYKKNDRIKKAVEGDVIAFAKAVSSVVTQRQKYIGYALQTKVANIEAGINLVKAAKSDAEWKRGMEAVGTALDSSAGMVKKLKERIVNSKERLALIQEAKDTIDAFCGDGGPGIKLADPLH